MNIIVYMVLTALFFTLGYNISRFVKDTVAWKQKRNNKIYKVFRPEDAPDALMNGIYVGAATLVAYTSFGLFEATVISVIAFLAVYGIRIDQRIRIIPNEMVLCVLVIGLIYQFVSNGFHGLSTGLIAMLLTGILFFATAFLTKAFSGSLGVGAGDIKLAIALSFMLGLPNILTFLIGIVLCLLIYIVIGFYTKTMYIGSTFPMCAQLMGGALFALYYPVISMLICSVLLGC